MLTMEMMQRRWPHGDQHTPGLLEGVVAASKPVFAKYGLTTPLAVAHAMAQFSAECGQGLEMVESLRYSAQGLLRTFPTHFTPDMAERWQYNEQMIGMIAYGGRMGNAPPPSTDGFDFRGAGFAQTTGRAGYKMLQATLDKYKAGFDILQKPTLIMSADHALECGVADFLACKCLPPSAKDDVKAVTKALNGGYNGLEERTRQLVLWKAELGIGSTGTAAVVSALAAAETTLAPSNNPPLPDGPVETINDPGGDKGGAPA